MTQPANIPIRFSAEHRATLEAAAKRMGLPLSTFVRSAALLTAAALEDMHKTAKVRRGLERLQDAGPGSKGDR